MAPSSPKMVKDSHMVWVDCEMTGLDTSRDHLLEIAVIITDKDLNILAEGPDLVIHQTDEVCNIAAKPDPIFELALTLTCQIIVQQILLFFGEKNTCTTLLGLINF